jgi:hypothetical protein
LRPSGPRRRRLVARSKQTKTARVSTEPIASPPRPAAGRVSCGGCGSLLADDQRYCLECGERRIAMSSLLQAGPPEPAAPSRPPGSAGRPSDPPLAGERGNTLTVVAGVGVLLLAMGMGVLIGRSGGAKGSAGPSVISVGSTPASTTSNAAAEAPLADDWPSGTSGYTVQLRTLPKAATTVSAVEAAKAQASAEGAKRVGVLKSEDFSSLVAGNYVIYAGVYHKRADAERALAGLKKRFQGASVIRVADGSGSSPYGAGNSGGHGGLGSSIEHPAPPSSVESLKSVKGKSYEERSKNLPDVISTG